MAGGGGNEIGSGQREDEAARQARIREGIGRINQTFDGQFNEPFFQGRRAAYSEYATPQLQREYGDAQRELAFYLARSGLGDSSVRASKEADLTRMFDRRATEVADKANDYERTARNAVEDSRGALISQVNATGDADQAARDANARAVALSKPENFDPVTNLFSDFVDTLGKQAASERAEAASGGAYRANFNTGLFGPNRGATRVSGR